MSERIDPRESQAYTVPEAALVWRVSTKTVRRWIAQGVVSATKPGRAYLITEAEVRRVLAPSRKESA